jgi:uncharacterized NAD(P)/FAD-binding protein YdhS
MTAVHLLSQDKIPLEVTVVEPRKKLGLGLAYSTTHPEHLLNVPASAMSALPDDPNHFLEYARSKDPSFSSASFAPRILYGEYLQSLIAKSVAQSSADRGTLTHLRSTVVDIEKMENDYLLTLATKTQLNADFVVLALGNLIGIKPRWLDKVGLSSKRYLHDPWDKSAIKSIPPDEDILLIGTGLTAIDKVIEIASNEHRGRILALSRHGLFPQQHLEHDPGPCVRTRLESGSILKSLSELRHRIDAASDWRSVIDGLRPVTLSWWRSLPVEQQKAFIRHLQTYWDIHRHRMAPEIAAKIAALLDSGQLVLMSGRTLSMQEIKTGLQVSIRSRNTGELVNLVVGRVINCTGPQYGLENVDSPLISNLLARGLIRSHKTGAGMDCGPEGKIVNSSGVVSSRLFAVGPLLKAELMESVAVPELRQQCKALAQVICDLILTDYLPAKSVIEEEKESSVPTPRNFSKMSRRLFTCEAL